MNAASILRSKPVATLSAGVLGAGLLGGVAFAAFPSTGDAATSTLSDTRVAGAQQEKRDSRLKIALDALVAKGVINQAQEDAIIAAVHGERADHPKLKEFIGNVFKASVDYIGLPADQVKKELRSGKSLGQIASMTPNKSRDGLIKFLDDAANKRIDAAIDAGKITKDKAADVRTKVDQAIVRIVDREGHPKPAPKPAQAPKPTN